LPVMPSAGFRYKVLTGKAFYLKGNLSRNYNLPSLNDLYWIPGGNPDLRPENSINGDLSLEFSRAGKQLVYHGSINGFATRVEDWILWKPGPYGHWEAENLALVFSRGMDLQLGSDMAMGNWLLTLKANYAYTRSTNEGIVRSTDLSRGKQLIYIPVHSSNAFLNLARSGYFLNWSISYTGRRYTQPSNEENGYLDDLDPYTLQDLHLGKTWSIGQSNAALRFTVYNIFNISYQAVRSRPMPMRNYSLTLSLEI
ncbi:MAG: TonB-dependent receptor, partial [Bacteroidales bacterium]|nr:TonB-dependent receptor [Bacteroidales bacterium]